MKFNTFTKLFAILNAFIIQIAYSLTTSKNTLTNLGRNKYSSEIRSKSTAKRAKPEIFKSIYAPMILAGDTTHEMKIQSFGTFNTKKMFAPKDEPESGGWFFKLGMPPQNILSKVMLHSRENLWYIPYNYITSDIVYRKQNATNSYFEGYLTNKNAEKVQLRININHNSKTKVLPDELAFKIVDFVNRRRVYNKPDIAGFYMEYSKTLKQIQRNNPTDSKMPGAQNKKNDQLNPLNPNNKNNILAPANSNNPFNNNPLNPANNKANTPGANALNPTGNNPANPLNPASPGANNPNKLNPLNPAGPGSNNPNRANPAGGNNPLNPNSPGLNNPNNVNPGGNNPLNPASPGANNPNKANPAGGNNPLNPAGPGSNNPNKANPTGNNPANPLNPASPGANNPNKLNPLNPAGPGSNNPNKLNPLNPAGPGSNNPNKANPAGGNNPLNPNSPGLNNPNKVNPAGNNPLNPAGPGSNNPNKANPTGGNNPLNPNSPGLNNPNKGDPTGANNPNQSNIPGAAASDNKTNGLPGAADNKKNNPLNINTPLSNGLNDGGKNSSKLNPLAHPSDNKNNPFQPANPNNPINNGKTNPLNQLPVDPNNSKKHGQDPSKNLDALSKHLDSSKKINPNDPLNPYHPNNKKNNLKGDRRGKADPMNPNSPFNKHNRIRKNNDLHPSNPNGTNKKNGNQNKQASGNPNDPNYKKEALGLKPGKNGGIKRVPNGSSDQNQFDDKNAIKIPIGGFIHYNEQRKDTGEFLTRIVIKPDSSKDFINATGNSGNRHGNAGGPGNSAHPINSNTNKSVDIESSVGFDMKDNPLEAHLSSNPVKQIPEILAGAAQNSNFV